MVHWLQGMCDLTPPGFENRLFLTTNWIVLSVNWMDIINRFYTCVFSLFKLPAVSKKSCRQNFLIRYDHENSDKKTFIILYVVLIIMKLTICLSSVMPHLFSSLL